MLARILQPLAIAALLIGTCHVSDVRAAERAEERSQHGPWAIQFGISNNFQLATFQGASLAAYRQTGPGSALRFAVTALGSRSDTDQYDPRTLSTRSTAGSGNSATVAATGYAIREVGSGGTRLYYGAGPSASLGLTGSDLTQIVTYPSDSPDTTWTDRSGNSWGVGVAGVTGVAWDVKPAITLFAEYGADLMFNYRRNETETRRSYSVFEDRTVTKQRQVAFTSRGVRFGMTAWF